MTKQQRFFDELPNILEIRSYSLVKDENDGWICQRIGVSQPVGCEVKRVIGPGETFEKRPSDNEEGLSDDYVDNESRHADDNFLVS